MKPITLLLLLLASVSFAKESVSIGSKPFTEGYLLGELAAQALQAEGAEVQRRFGLGGTGIIYEALKNGNIALYPEYTGTISEVLLKKPGISLREMQIELSSLGLVATDSLGFENTYAIAVTKNFAEQHGLRTISDLHALQSRLEFAFSYEFMNRADGFSSFSKAYDLTGLKKVSSMDHALAYTALEQGTVNAIEVYSTDGKIQKLGLQILEDDKKFFPKYEAVFLARKDFVERQPEFWQALKKFEGRISAEEMQKLNSAVENDRQETAEVIRSYLANEEAQITSSEDLRWNRIWMRTKEHLVLVFISLSVAALLGVPLGILAYGNRHVGQFIVATSSGVQTIPSLALLCFFIPFFGVGLFPALVALSLYSLLPVILNTIVGLRSIDPSLRESAKAIGLSSMQMLRLVELPLASRSILTGIKTAGIINIGTATLAALIGAGGYGAAILRGLAMNDIPTILEGAIPAAILAFGFQWLFSFLEKFMIPLGLRLKD